MKQIRCRYAPSLGALEGTPMEAWGTRPWSLRHLSEPTVFFGMYDLRDYLAVWLHAGKAWVLWAGSDIRNLHQGFAFNDGKLRWLSRLTCGLFNRWLVAMLNSKAEHWCENGTEADALRKCGIRLSGIGPSFMGDTGAFVPRYRHRSKINVYCSAPEGREEEYGFALVERVAGRFKKARFHLYGSDRWTTRRNNVTVHGRVCKERMNREIRNMQVALRLNEFDGFSEIVAKGILMGHHVVSAIDYPLIPSKRTVNEIVTELKRIQRYGQEGADPRTREHYLKTINLSFPWSKKELCT